ncbi:MAG: immunoglobulin-like domain-containing protein, partial [Tannerellaceae bacterium]
HQKGRIQYIAHTALNDNTLQIINSHVFVKPRPTAMRETVQYGSHCSTSYRNTLYYKENSMYRNILEKTMVDQVTYYRVAGQLAPCKDLRREVIEGTQIQPMWMTSLYVDYQGDPLKIKAKWVGNPPLLTITSHPILTEGSTFEPLDYVVASDKEDGDLTSKIVILDSNYKNMVGEYYVMFYVEDSDRESATARLRVQVIPTQNNPPTIKAENQTLYQYSEFEPLQDVSAYDEEDGPISQIDVQGSVDTTTLGTYQLTYGVVDSKGLSTHKTVEIRVIAHPMAQYRYLDRKHPFYMQNTPLNWKNHLIELQYELQKNTTYVTRIIE